MTTTDYTDPATIDVDEVMANIDWSYSLRGGTWTDDLSWPNVTVKALANEVRRLRAENERLHKVAYLTIRVPSFLRRQRGGVR